VSDLGTSFNFTQGSYLAGFDFQVSHVIAITQLGFYDSNLSAPAANAAQTFVPTPVGIYDLSTHTLLGSATVQASDPATGFYRYVSLPHAIVLNTTDTYAVVGVTGTNNYVAGGTGLIGGGFGGSGATMNPAVTLLSEACLGVDDQCLTQTTTLVEPNAVASWINLGPNFAFETPPAVDAGTGTAPAVDAGTGTAPAVDAGTDTAPVVDAGTDTDTGTGGGTAASQCLAAFVNPFAAMTPYWADWSSSTCGSITASNGNLVLTRNEPCSAPSPNVIAGLNQPYLLCGDFDVQVDFAVAGLAAGVPGGIFASMRANDPAVTTTGMTIERYAAAYLPSSYSYQNYKSYTDNKGDDTTSTLVPAADVTGRFRLTRSGTTVKSYYWKAGTPDAGDGLWILVKTATLTSTPWVLVLYAGDNSAASAGPAPYSVTFTNLLVTFPGAAGTGTVLGPDAGASDTADAPVVGDTAGSSCPGGTSESCSADPPSCASGLTCGAAAESCCTSPEVTGGTFYRTYTNDGSGPTAEADPATVSSFRLDKYDVTVGRFRQFVSAWNAGWSPTAGSGKHIHLNGGLGLANSGAPGTYEPGWIASDTNNVAPTDANLACSDAGFSATWTSTAGTQENLPMNCTNWWEAYAFCIWDGGFLPTAAEWRYAAAGGSQQREYPWGSTDPGTGSQYAIYGVTSVAPVGSATSGVGLWGQLDLTGNIGQWGLDGCTFGYVNPCTDCVSPTATTGALALCRVGGGSDSRDSKSDLLSAARVLSSGGEWSRYAYFGFRCARTP
jgi:formylglycine-generating enzyme required for sulfatase activity